MSSFSISANFSNTAGILLCFLISKLVFVCFFKEKQNQSIVETETGTCEPGEED